MCCSQASSCWFSAEQTCGVKSIPRNTQRDLVCGFYYLPIIVYRLGGDRYIVTYVSPQISTNKVRKVKQQEMEN